MNTTLSPSRLALIGGSVLAAATLSYAIYFDHRRRHDPAFRKRLLRDHRRAARRSQAQQADGRQEASAALRRALVLIASEPVPADVQQKEAYFMEQVGFGEQLAARSPEHYVASAVSFYRALRVYPAPTELIAIYQKTQPAQVFEYVMELVALDIGAATQGGVRTSDPRDSISSDAVLTEIDVEIESSSPRPSSENGSGSSNPSTEGSYVHVEEPGSVDAARNAPEDPPEAAL